MNAWTSAVHVRLKPANGIGIGACGTRFGCSVLYHSPSSKGGGMAWRARETRGPDEAMNFIAAICKLLYRNLFRNKLIALLVMATVTILTVCVFTFGGTQQVYETDQLRGLRGEMGDIANSLQSLQAQVSALGSREQKQRTELTYWLSTKDVSYL